MSRVLRRTAVLLLAALASAAPASAFRLARLVGKVVDPQGKPLSGVTVTATSKDVADFNKVTATDSKGIFILDFDRINVVYHYRLEKPGWVTSEVDQTWTLTGTDRHTFTLQPGETPPVAEAPVAAASSSPAAVTAFNAGARAFEAKDHETARARFEEALRHDPQLRQGWAALAMVLVELKRHQEAAEAADKAVALGARDAAVLLARWEAYRHLGDEAKTKQAREDLEKAGRLQEEAKRIHNMGVAFAKAGNDAEALAKFKEAVDADPTFAQGWLAVAVTSLKLGRPAEAVAAAEKLLEADPQNKEAPKVRYNAALQVADEAKIVDALVGLAAVDPATARDGLYKLATTAFDADAAAAAKDRFAKLLAVDPNHPRGNYYMGVLLVREGVKAEARRHLQRFLQLAPNDSEAETARGLLAFIAK